MDIKEVIELRNETQQKITDILKDFELKTGTEVVNLDVIRSYTVGLEYNKIKNINFESKI